MTAPIIATTDLSKRFGATAAVDGLSITIEAERITGFLGRNGAGKSTTIKMLLGMMRPTSGRGTVLGHRIDRPSESRLMRRRVAYVAEEKPVYSYMTVQQMLDFGRAFYSDWRIDAERKLLNQYDLPKDKAVRTLSKGMRTKLALLLALARQPSLRILDEPSEGLDPVSIEEFLQAVTAAAADGTTVFFSSHRIGEVERIADSVCIVDRGSLRLHTDMDTLREQFRLVTASFADRVPHLSLLPGQVTQLITEGRQCSMLTSHNASELAAHAYAIGAISVDVRPVGLRDVFLAVSADALGQK